MLQSYCQTNSLRLSKEKEIEKKIKYRKENPQKEFFISLLHFLKKKFPNQEEKINQTVQEIIKKTEQEREKVD